MSKLAISRRQLLTGGSIALAATAIGAIPPAGAAGSFTAAGASDEVVLTVTGRLSANRGFTLTSFEDLGLSQLTTKTPWDHVPVSFEGVRLDRFREALGITGDLRVTALNDYSAVVPATDAKVKPLLATRRNGVPLSIRDKGPVFLVYPFDSSPELSNEAVYARCVWQITAIEAL